MPGSLLQLSMSQPTDPARDVRASRGRTLDRSPCAARLRGRPREVRQPVWDSGEPVSLRKEPVTLFVEPVFAPENSLRAFAESGLTAAKAGFVNETASFASSGASIVKVEALSRKSQTPFCKWKPQSGKSESEICK